MRRSTLTLWMALSALLIFAACATIAPPQPPSLDLPKAPADLRASRKGDRVTLTWTIPSITTDRQTIRNLGPTLICRGLTQLQQCGTPVGKTASLLRPNTTQSSKQKQQTAGSYTDILPAEMGSDEPSTAITYAVEALNTDGRGAGLSNQVRVSLIRTLPPPQDFQAHVTSQGVVLSWTSEVISNVPAPSVPAVHYLYRVHRIQEGSQQQTLTGEVPVGSGRELTLTDSGIEWEKTYEYRAEAVTVIAQEGKPEVEVEGDDTPSVKVFADDVFHPAVPSGLQAVFSGPGQKPFIDLVWAPVTDGDLAGYNVYRHEEGAAASKLTGELVKTPAYRDESVASGKRYFYSVSAVDIRGNESARSEEASETVPQ